VIVQQEIKIPTNLLERLQSLQANTMHRLLGYSDRTNRFSCHERAPLPIDLMLVDESSMISTQLMHALFCALDTLKGQREACQLILMGDAQQLSAVEIGSPFADLLKAANDPLSVLHGCAHVLTRQWRADANLAGLALALRALLEKSFNDADVGAVFSLFAKYSQFPNESIAAQKMIVESVQAGTFDGLFQADSLDSAWQALNHARVLCATHAGPEGQIAVNALIESELRARFQRPKSRFPKFFQGQLLMASRNDYALGIMNGDVGLVWPNASGELRFYMERHGEWVDVSPAQLPDPQPAFALTVHKAQGSEFDRVLFVLPSVGAEKLLHIVLVYTAITRAKRHLTVIARPEVLRSALSNTLQRRSGFLQRLSFK
jgi:exodeoxyribonuclease V alpha subunit